jgi:hypothetical protein
MSIKQGSFNPELLRYTSYKKPKTIKTMRNIYGYDTETSTEGNLLCACLHTGRTFDVTNLAESLLKGVCESLNLITYNLEFELAQLLKQIPELNREELRSTSKTTYNNITYKTVGKKALTLTKNKAIIHFWDIAQFYYASLDKASRDYLFTNKAYIPYNELTPEYFQSHHKEIESCCTHHAYLTYKLAMLLLSELKVINLNPNKLYSTASIASLAFHRNCTWTDLTGCYNHRLDFIHAFQNAYAGGLFVNPFRGSDYLYLYDVVSMYPTYIAQLKDIGSCDWIKSTVYQPKAYYAALLCKIDITDFYIHPCGLLNGYIRYYPSGTFTKWITKQEYDFLIKYNYNVTILQGYWITPFRHYYPFRKYINQLITQKSMYKAEGGMRYNLVKTIMNSMYGKFIQLNENNNGTIKAGVDYNPIFVSFITASSRVKMCELSRQIPGLTYAIHTDSIITNKPIPPELLGNQLGSLSFEKEGEGIIIAPGLYEIGNKVKTRCFNKKNVQNLSKNSKTFSFKQLFLDKPNQKSFNLKVKQVLSWRLGTIRHDTESIGKFIVDTKTLNLNEFNARNWPTKTNSTKLLTGVEESYPYVIFESNSDKVILKKHGVTVNPHYHYNNKHNPNIVKPLTLSLNQVQTQEEEKHKFVNILKEEVCK